MTANKKVSAMADSEDLRELFFGALDASGFDLINANLSSSNLFGRNFVDASLYGANFDRSRLDNSNLSNKTLLDVTFNQASLRRVKINTVALTGCQFISADLRQSDLSFTRFIDCDFSDADLRGCNFNNTTIENGCKFDRCNHDETTSFEGAAVSRKLARSEVFQRYTHADGKLTLKTAEEIAAIAPVPSRVSIERAIAEAEMTLNDVRLRQLDLPSLGVASSGVGHNSANFVPEPDEKFLEELRQTFAQIRLEMRKAEPETASLATGRDKLIAAAKVIGTWIAHKGDLFLEEFMKTLGQEAAKFFKLYGLYALLAGAVMDVAQMIVPLIVR